MTSDSGARPRSQHVIEGELVDGCSQQPTWSNTAEGLTLKVWRARYWKDGPEDFGYRSVSFRVSSNRKSLASGKFVEWCGPPQSFLDDFFYAADAMSQADHDTADILISRWGEDKSPFDYGTIVRFERLVVSSHSPAIWALISRLIGREFMRRGSIMMLKAFPLEYEGRLGANAPIAFRHRFKRRCKAMQRHYRHRLEMRIVPGSYGRDGWMWRPLRYCPTPNHSLRAKIRS